MFHALHFSFSFFCRWEEQSMNQSENWVWLSGQLFHKYTCLAFCVYLICIPGLQCEKLFCYYCPIQLINKQCKHVLTGCLPGQQCFTANGNYGNYSSIFIKGCIAENKCLKKSNHSIYGISISLHYDCCTYDYCNSGPHMTRNSIIMEVMLIALALFDKN